VDIGENAGAWVIGCSNTSLNLSDHGDDVIKRGLIIIVFLITVCPVVTSKSKSGRTFENPAKITYDTIINEITLKRLA
jgi:hypothetical protein